MFPYYSLANGFLTGKYRSKDDLGKSPRGLRTIEYLEGKGPRVLAALDAVAAETGASLATVALAWTKAQPGITAPIASATSLEQFADLAAALTLELPRRRSSARTGERTRPASVANCRDQLDHVGQRFEVRRGQDHPPAARLDPLDPAGDQARSGSLP